MDLDRKQHERAGRFRGWWRRFARLFADASPRPAVASPTRPPTNAALSDKEAYYRGAARSRFPGKRILILEDNEACCEILRNVVVRWEMEVTVAASCKAALAALDAAASFDFAVLDHTLGDGTGDDVARAMRAHGQAGACALVSLTGNRFLPDRSLYDAAIEKPISPDTLRSTLIDLLDHQAPKRKPARLASLG